MASGRQSGRRAGRAAEGVGAGLALAAVGALYRRLSTRGSASGVPPRPEPGPAGAEPAPHTGPVGSAEIERARAELAGALERLTSGRRAG